MIRRPPRSTRTDTLFPYTPLFRSYTALAYPPSGASKLQVLDWTLDLATPFSVLAAVTGMVLINAANSGLDQDTTQRLLACDSARQGSRALYRSEEHTSELQSLMRISSAVFCLKKKKRESKKN